MEPYVDIPPTELKRRLDAAEPIAILDVRDPWEHELCAIPGARLIPMDQLQGRVDELDSEREIVVYCHHGAALGGRGPVAPPAGHPGRESARRDRRLGRRGGPGVAPVLAPRD